MTKSLTISAKQVDQESRSGGVPQSPPYGAGHDGVSVNCFRDRCGFLVDGDSLSHLYIRVCDGFEAWEQERDGVWFRVQEDYSLVVAEGLNESGRAINPLVPNSAYRRLLEAIPVAVAAYKAREGAMLPLGAVYK